MMTVQMSKPFLLLATTLACLWLAGCGGPSEGPEAALRAWVAQGHERAEEKDRRGLVDMISPDYVDARGNSRDDISDLFRIYFLRTHTVALITKIDELNAQVLAEQRAKTVDAALAHLFEADHRMDHLPILEKLDRLERGGEIDLLEK